MQSTTSNDASSSGSSSAAPTTSACSVGTTSTPTYSRAVAKNGRYGFTPQPTSSTRRPAASRPSASSQRESGSSIDQLRSPRLGRRRSPPGHSSRSATRAPARCRDQPEREPRQRSERRARDEPLPDPRRHRDEQPEQPDRRREGELRRPLRRTLHPE